MEIHVNESSRSLREIRLDCDLAICGGGLSGVCAAVTAAREELKVVLIQDRPVLGGNASSELRLWALGATSHMGNNNRWAREGGVIDEIVVENLHRNPEGNPVLFDAVLLDLVYNERNITLLMDTAVSHLAMEDGEISSLNAFCSQNATLYDVHAPLFCDSSGDGILGYLSGADYRIGAESREEFGEQLAPDEFYGELLGHTIYFYTKDTGTPVDYVAPGFAMTDISRIPRAERIRATDSGCSFWWLEYGGRLDTIHDNHEIKKELLSVSYGIWDHIKNSGRFPEAANLTLEWVGLIPGKRESRRFEGDYMLRQQDVIEQTVFDDAVSYGGWAVDLHPADGVYSELPACNQYHSKGVYQIPWRCYYSRNIPNLFMTGRLISATHVAFGSTRVMMTGGHGGQAVGMGAAHCLREGCRPRNLLEKERFHRLKRDLLRCGQFIPFADQEDPEDLAGRAEITASSCRRISKFPGSGSYEPLDHPRGFLLPLPPEELPEMSLKVRTGSDQVLCIQLRRSEKEGNFSPECILEEQLLTLAKGEREISFRFKHREKDDFYGMITFIPQGDIELEVSELRLAGFLSLYHEQNEKVAKSAVQTAPVGSGIHGFEFWLPHRRPAGKLPALGLDPPLAPYAPMSAGRGWERPGQTDIGWLAEADDSRRELKLEWREGVNASQAIFSFDTDFDHPMESAQWGHPERHIPFCVRHFRVKDQDELILAEVEDNYNSRCVIPLPDRPLRALKLEILASWGAPAAVFRVRVVPR